MPVAATVSAPEGAEAERISPPSDMPALADTDTVEVAERVSAASLIEAVVDTRTATVLLATSSTSVSDSEALTAPLARLNSKSSDILDHPRPRSSSGQTR